MNRKHSSLDHSQQKIHKTLQSEGKLNTQMNLIKNQENQETYKTQENHQKQKSCFHPIEFMADFFSIYKFGDKKDEYLMIFGIFLAILSGVAFPLFMYIWGKEVDHVINDYLVLDKTLDLSRDYYLAFLALGVGSFLINGLAFAIWKLLSETIAKTIRLRYLQNFIKRKTKWHQDQNLYEVSSSFQSNCLTIEKATGDKVALLYSLIGIIISGLILALCVRWTYALYLFALLPLGLCALGYFIYIFVMRKIQTQQSYAKAQTQSSEAVSLIKTVKMLGAEKFQQEIYNQCLSDYEQKIKSYPIKVGVSTALFFFIQYFILGVGFLLGIQCVRGTSACPVSITGSAYSIGDLHSVFFQTYICTYYFLQLAANFDAIKNAINSFKRIDKFIKQTQEQVAGSPSNGHSDLPDLINKVEFRNVSFAYSSNPNKQILKRTSFKLAENKFNAIVGVTGSGKSTITNLILKLYTPSEGQILIGNKDISLCNSEQLRERIGVVTQEPVLFSGTIRQNVTVGKTDATDDQIWSALREASISEFVKSKPQGLNFDVGFGGAKLSGGQKQRIAIARALIKKPQLLLLDQATSALDRKSEKVIQKTLQSIFLRQNLSMTVLCIAHKIKTIRKADKIMVLQNGIIKQEGRFQELNCFKDIQIPSEQQNPTIEYNIDEQFQSIQTYQLQSNKNKAFQGEQYKQNIYQKLLSYTENYSLYVFGLFMAFLNGLNHPAATLLFSYAYTQSVKLVQYKLWTPPIYIEASVLDDYHIKATKFLGGLIGFSFFVFIPQFLQFYIMTKIEDQITKKIRKEVFKKLMIMPAQWYDKPENEGGKVASRYGLDVKQISRLVSNFIPILITNITTIAGGVIICLIYLWQVGLLSLFCIPLIALGGYISINFISGYQDQSLHRYEQSDKVACELMVNVKTAYALNYQRKLLQKYKAMIEQDRSKILWRGAKIGFFFVSALLFIKTSIGTTFWVSDNILADLKTMDTMGITVSLIIPTWCGWLAGNNFFFAAHAATGKKSAQNIFQLLEEKTQKQVQQRGSSKIIRPLKNEIKGRVQFKNVSFKYSESSKYVLKDVSFVIQAGQKAAFVGESGCGKSTLMLLMQRFYVYEGQISLDGVSILQYDLEQYRKYLGVLSQQPSLFTGTVESNIVFNSECRKQEVYEACQMSFAYDVTRSWKGQISLKDNINEFIRRDAGSKGSKLSGGERQRVACARAILKNPKIFLSDEGTSALDRETQKIVQRNIDNKFKGTTSVNVAHRMETIENADQIFMLQNGKIIEFGTYNQMLERKDHFFRFVNGTNQKQPTSYQNEFKQ